MRDILFKAKRIDNGEWVEGDLAQDRDLKTMYIQGFDYYTGEGGWEREPFCYQINPETLSQYTELDGMNGNKIWENDIVQDTGGCIGKVLFENYQWQVEIIKSKYILSLGQTFPLWQWDECERNGFRKLEVIGNVFDNPELLEGKE